MFIAVVLAAYLASILSTKSDPGAKYPENMTILFPAKTGKTLHDNLGGAKNITELGSGGNGGLELTETYLNLEEISLDASTAQISERPDVFLPHEEKCKPYIYNLETDECLDECSGDDECQYGYQCNIPLKECVLDI